MALAEFPVGRGFLLGSLIGTVRANGNPALPVHCDQDMFPAPLPEHNMMLTACWACDAFTKEGRATLVVPGTRALLRHPTNYRVLLRQGDNYSDVADELIERYGTPMSQLLGEEDYFYKKDFD